MTAAVTCSVITPTWQRHDFLLERCIPSVQAQDHPAAEHVIVSDGPDPELRDKLAALALPGTRFSELPEHDPAARWGHWARLRGIELARGEYITYNDDDDALRPEHCRLLAAALDEHPDADFAYSQMNLQGSIIGGEPPAYCQIGTPQIMHRRGLLAAATWEQSLPSIDWDLVERWLKAGARYVHVPAVTVDAWPSAYR